MININIQSLHFDASERLKEFINKKFAKLEKVSDDIISIDVTLKVINAETGDNKESSVKINVKNDELFASKTADSFEEAVTLCLDALDKQLVKYKEKVQRK